MIAAKNAKVAKVDWKTVKLGEVCDIKTGKLNSCAATENGRYPFFTCAENPLRIDTPAYNSESVLVAGNCTPYVNYYKGKFNAYQRTYIITPKSDDILGRWLYFWMRRQIQYMIHRQQGSVEKYFVLADFTEEEIYLPPLPTQRKIAAVLGALDDKIENNRKICANLEAQAQALFKSWFVDFEPWGGEMPKEWKMGSLYEFADIIYGAPFKSKLFNEKGDGRPIIRIRDLKNNETKTYTTERHDKEYVVQAGDLVVGMDGEFRPYVWGNKPALLNQRVCVFKPKDKVSTAYLLFSIKPQLEFVEATEAATTVIHIGKEDFDSFKISIPSKDWLSKFNGIAQKQIDLSTRLRQYNVVLAELRDALLPKLMSGELDVDDVEV